MITFILIFFLSIIAVGALSIFGFAFYLKRRKKSLAANNSKQFDEPPPFRSLFEQTDEETRAEEQAKSVASTAKKAEEARLLKAEKIEAARDFQKIWANEPNKLNTLELFRLAAESADAAAFSETAETVITFRRENGFESLTATDLADLLDSHLATLPQQERTAGALFWLRREIKSLRADGSE